MKPELIIMALTAIVWTVAGNTQTQQDEEQVISEKAFEQIELDAESDVVTRGLSHTGTISEIHLNLEYYGKEWRSTCIKMNPTIPGRTPWACLYMKHMDPVVHHTRGWDTGADAQKFAFLAMGQEHINRLLHDAFINNKRCKIVFTDYISSGRLNNIDIVSCYN